MAVKPDLADLYLEVMGTIFKANESQSDNDIKRTTESISRAESKLASLEEKYVLNEIDKDRYSFMKPKFSAEIKKLRDKLDETAGTETNYTKYLKLA